MKLLYLFGPNLGQLGTRDPEKYGTQTLSQIMDGVGSAAAAAGHEVTWHQSDQEAELEGWMKGAAADGAKAIVINPGALTHFSENLRDAAEASGLPVIEVHQTNIYAREAFRQHSVLSPVCRVVIAGAGPGGYHLALEALRWIMPEGEPGSPNG